MNSENIQILWAELIVEELKRLGVTFFGYAPGSRNAPFAAALVSQKIKPYVHYDERGLAFAALGAAKTSGRPVAIFATSGSAGVNFAPALVEAKESGIPLIVITGDRPPELLEVGEGQTIDQVKMFSNFSSAFFDMPCPSDIIEPQFVLSTIDSLMYKAVELRGPVHLNVHFREPLYPKKVPIRSSYLDPITPWLNGKTPHTTWEKREAKEQIELPIEIREAKRGLIILGRLESDDEVQKALELIEMLKWPVFADLTSHLAYVNSSYVLPHYDWILASYDLGNAEGEPENIPSHLQFDAVVQLGHEFLSKRLRLFLKNRRPYLMTIAAGERRYDPGHVTRMRIAHSIQSLNLEYFNGLKASESLLPLKEENAHARSMIEESGSIHDSLARCIPDDMNIFLASSFSIREFGWFVTKCRAKRFFANRGASGIDGLIASSIGVGLELGEPVVLFIGDLAFCYDMNSLSIASSLKAPLVIVIFNNEGGGIFHLLPIAEHKDILPLLEAKHSLNIEAVCAAFSFTYARVDEGEEDRVVAAFDQAISEKKHTIIEIKVKSETQVKNIRSMIQRSKGYVAQANKVNT